LLIVLVTSSPRITNSKISAETVLLFTTFNLPVSLGVPGNSIKILLPFAIFVLLNRRRRLWFFLPVQPFQCPCLTSPCGQTCTIFHPPVPLFLPFSLVSSDIHILRRFSPFGQRLLLLGLLFVRPAFFEPEVHRKDLFQLTGLLFLRASGPLPAKAAAPLFRMHYILRRPPFPEFLNPARFTLKSETPRRS